MFIRLATDPRTVNIILIRVTYFFQVLLLHKNQIGSLRGCEKFIPAGLTTLTLNDNHVSDLCDVSHLSHLVRLFLALCLDYSVR